MHIDLLVTAGLKRGDHVAQLGRGLTAADDLYIGHVEMNRCGHQSLEHLLDAHTGSETAELASRVADYGFDRRPRMSPAWNLGEQDWALSRVPLRVRQEKRLRDGSESRRDRRRPY